MLQVEGMSLLLLSEQDVGGLGLGSVMSCCVERGVL